MADFLIDTDVFVDHLRGARELDPKSHRIHYSVVTRAELFAGNIATEVVRILLAPFREISVGREIAERAGRLRRESPIRLSDALIAATAVEHELTLFTRHRADFAGVRGLRIREILSVLFGKRPGCWSPAVFGWRAPRSPCRRSERQKCQGRPGLRMFDL